MPIRTFTPPHPTDLRRAVAPVQRGRGDPCVRFAPDGIWRATRTPHGPGTLHLRRLGGAVQAEAWGPGAEWVLDRAPELIGCHDTADGFDPSPHPLVRELARRSPGLRIGRTGAVTEAAVPTICEQKVTGFEARRSWRQIVRRYGEPAPGPADLWVPPSGDTLAGVGYHDLHVLGVERKRADTVRRLAAQSARLDAMGDGPPDALTARLTAIAGVGTWSAAEVAAVALGDPDAVSVGDYHLPRIVCFAVAGELDGTDERMLELLAPFAGHRGRVIRLLMGAGRGPARRGPRRSPREIAAI